MFLNSANANSRLLSASLLDKEQLEENARARRQGETQRQVASALLLPPSAQTRCRSAPDPITEGFFGTTLFGKLLSRQSSNTSRRDSDDSVSSQFGVVDSEQRQSRSMIVYYMIAILLCRISIFLTATLCQELRR